MSRYGSIRIGVIVGGTVLILVGSAWAQSDAGGDLVVHETGSSVELSLGESDPFHITENQVVNARLVEVPDSSVRLALWEEILLTGETECCNKSQEDCVEPSPTDADFALVASGVLGSCCLPFGNCINTTCSNCQQKWGGYFRRAHTCSTRICATQHGPGPP